MSCQARPLAVPGATQRILGADDHPDDPRGLAGYAGQLRREVFKGGPVGEREEEEESVCLLLASLGAERVPQSCTTGQNPPACPGP